VLKDLHLDITET